MTLDDTTQDSTRPSTPRWLIHGSLLVAFLLVVVAVGAVGWNYYHRPFPNAALFIRGDADCDGAEVIVSDNTGGRVFHDRLTKANEYQLVVLVENGFYGIIARRNGVTLIDDRLFVANGGGALVQITPPRLRSATQPGPSSSP